MRLRRGDDAATLERRAVRRGRSRKEQRSRGGRDERHAASTSTARRRGRFGRNDSGALLSSSANTVCSIRFHAASGSGSIGISSSGFMGGASCA